MPKLFDLLSENTDDKTIQSLRKIASKKPSLVNKKPSLVNKKPSLVNKKPQDSNVAQPALVDSILKRLDFIALDLETTGLDNKNDRVIEIGAIKVIGGVAQEEYSTFIQPTIAIPPYITSLTGIKDEDVAQAPEFSEIAKKLMEFIGDLPLCGHQIEFDINFLNEEYKRANMPRVFMKQIDTALLARILMPSLARYTLGFVAKTLSVTLENAHRALDDARASGHVAIKLIPKLCEMSLPVRAAMANCAPPSLIRHVLHLSLQQEKNPYAEPAIEIPRAPKKLSPKETIEPLDIQDITPLFGSQGSLAKSVAAYSERPSQTSMAACVTEALSSQTSLVAEAGTGTGKSLAYLVPAAIFALKNNCRVLISTHTRNLQDQLIAKDLPVVKEVAGKELLYSVLKGRANYLCKKRYYLLLSGELGDFSYRERMGMLPLVRWVLETKTGDIEEQNQFNIKWFARVWHLVCADSHSCDGRRCPQFHQCFLQLARQKALGSHIVVINHALFFSELCAESSFLGRLGPIIFDEAHHLEACGHRHLRTEIDSKRLGAFSEMAQNLGKDIKKWESLDKEDGISEEAYKPIVKRIRQQIKVFLDDTIIWAKQKTAATADYQCEYDSTAFSERGSYLAIDTMLADLQDVLHGFAQTFDAACTDKNETDRLFQTSIVTLAETTSQLKADFSYLTMAKTEDHVFWSEGNVSKGWIKLCGVPLDVGSILSSIWQANKAGRVFTSATLSIAGSMSYFMSKVGLSGAIPETTRSEIFSSPFSASQALRGAIRQAPELESPLYPAYVANAIHKLLGSFGKNILVLFTANSMLTAVYELLKKEAASSEYTILAQGFSGNRQAMLEEFKQSTRAVLLGADSFWEGIDVPGKACEIVIIPRLPFPVPTHPLTKALSKKIEIEKGESFMSFSVPEAVIKFRQGTGRLIRTQSDRGALIVLDNRIVTKGYGKHFTSSLNGPFTSFDTLDSMVESVKAFFDENNSPSSITYVPIEEI